MGKRGRKPNPNNDKNYFGEVEEKAVVDYLNADTIEEKDEIFNTYLKSPFTKLIECIIRTWKIYIPDETSGQTFNDALAFLIVKIDKFKPERNHKAYSYFGTIIKHYLFGRVKEYYDDIEKKESYDNVVDELKNCIEYTDMNDDSSRLARESVEVLINRIRENIGEYNDDDISSLTNEAKVGVVLANILDNWDWVLSTDCSQKLNKQAILRHLRDNTGLDGKAIRDNLKKYKKMYFSLKKELNQ